MRKVSREHDVPRLAGNRIDNPVCGVRRLQAARRREHRERVAAAQVRFGRLTRAHFSAVPDHVRLRTMCGGFLRKHVDVEAATVGEGPHRIHVGADGVAVMDEIQHVGR